MDEHADAPGGESLGHLIKKGRLDRGRVVTVLQQVADALDHAHANGKKPSNILLDDKKRAYVADFGLAHLAEASVVLTRTGMMAGTPQYMAPKQVMAKRVDLRADIYALGIVTYEMRRCCMNLRVATTVPSQRRHDPIANDAGRPSSVMRFRMLQAIAASVSCALECLARSRFPMIDLYRKKAFSTRACRW